MAVDLQGVVIGPIVPPGAAVAGKLTVLSQVEGDVAGGVSRQTVPTDDDTTLISPLLLTQVNELKVEALVQVEVADHVEAKEASDLVERGIGLRRVSDEDFATAFESLPHVIRRGAD